jgi:antitoxin component of RelBE/YafQ-DinJ toxin-antitoxin module
MAVPTVQVIVDEPLKHRLQILAKEQGLSVSSYVRVLINRHIVSIDRSQQQHTRLSDIYS